MPAASVTCLQEPAILLLIFGELPQRDLLLIQRVCRMWQATIVSSRALQSVLFFCPESSTASRRDSDQRPILNPLLQENFPGFFHQDILWNRFYSNAEHNLGPWDRTLMLGEKAFWTMINTDPLPTAPYPAYMYPTASWRRMLPWLPPINELQLNIGDQYQGILRGLIFPNDESRLLDARRHPPWLTFGLLYDLIEAAWFRADPYRMETVYIDDSFFPTSTSILEDYERRKQYLQLSNPWQDYSRPYLQHCFPHLHISGPGRLYVALRKMTKSDAELDRQRRQAVAERKGDHRIFQPHRHRYLSRVRFDDIFFTNEFRFTKGFMADEIQWDFSLAYGEHPAPNTAGSDAQGRTNSRWDRFSKLLKWRRS